MQQYLPQTGTNANPIWRTIGRVADLSITGLIESVRVAFLVVPLLFSLPQMARAETIVESVDYEIVEEAGPPPVNPKAIARFGPFAVIDARTAELNGETDAHSPAQFAQLLATYPLLQRINMIECAGTVDDEANLKVARMIRRAGLSTHVPANGSVRSGGVELFMAGVRRTHEKGAEFGVHSWEDEDGHQARDVPADDPVNAAYVRYYQDVGLPAETARAFYAFTNATPFDQLHVMSESELQHFHITN
jgi:hypothetical protein